MRFGGTLRIPGHVLVFQAAERSDVHVELHSGGPRLISLPALLALPPPPPPPPLPSPVMFGGGGGGARPFDLPGDGADVREEHDEAGQDDGDPAPQGAEAGAAEPVEEEEGGVAGEGGYGREVEEQLAVVDDGPGGGGDAGPGGEEGEGPEEQPAVGDEQRGGDGRAGPGEDGEERPDDAEQRLAVGREQRGRDDRAGPGREEGAEDARRYRAARRPLQCRRAGVESEIHVAAVCVGESQTYT